MAVDYNLVVLGCGPIACYAAVQARQYSARVALVLPHVNSSLKGISSPIAPSFLRHFNYSQFINQHGPYNMGNALFQPQNTGESALHPVAFPPRSVDWDCLVRSLPLLASASDDRYSSTSLEKLGIDVIRGNGQFVADPQWGFRVSDRFGTQSRTRSGAAERLLRSQSFLIALTGQAVVPAIAGIESVPYHTLDTFFQPDAFATQPQSVLIISDNEEGIAVANALTHLGTQVTLVMPTLPLLPSADPEVNQWLETSLIASGVKLYLGVTVQQFQAKGNHCIAEIKLGSQPKSDRFSSPPTPTTVKADELLLIMGQQVDFPTLNLRAIAVDYTTQGIPVDKRYRSSNPHVFAIGDAIDQRGTITQANHRQAEVAIALRHALFRGLLLPSLKAGLSLPPLVSPQALPVMVNTHPPAAWMGWTEPEARQRYGDRLQILYQSFQHLPQAQRLSAYIPHATAGFCKLIVLDNGQIVGVHIVGIQAEELVNLMAIAMHQSLPIDDLTPLYPPTPSLTADVLQGLLEQWNRDRPRRQPRLVGWLELAFNWQRDWTK
ncbi:MAG: NAD(P)/FAD-dependent oxidoreductase [Cyanothece sp. SIO2G6]|nr:NAD(P)/FAD-dependent oxidoreductase [Cyanothece sp. SIO2G6]